jgi:hypothetical protein
VQAYSHNQEANTTVPVGRPEAVEILNAVLEFMRKVAGTWTKVLLRVSRCAVSLLGSSR